MTDYTHRMSLVVPKHMMPAANQLALVAGESPDDVNTFTTANWADKEGNLYAVCSTVIKPIVLSMFGQVVSNGDAQSAMDIAVMYEQGMTASSDKIVIGVDIDPRSLFSELGLTMTESLLDVNNDK